jgi:hypothetical protein
MFSFKKNFLNGIILLALLLPACQLRRGGATYQLRERIKTSIFIELPSNSNVFENISSLVYESLVSHFQRVGYKVVSNQSSAYSLRITIKNLEPIQKYVSPDILLFHSTVKLELYCQLLNYRKEVVAEKTFYFDRLISKPKNPVLNSDFLNYEYKKLMWNAAPKIEQYFKKFISKSVEK